MGCHAKRCDDGMMTCEMTREMMRDDTYIFELYVFVDDAFVVDLCTR